MIGAAFGNDFVEAFRFILAAPFVLLVPGLALTRALFPHWPLRTPRFFLFSIALSISTLALGSVLLDLARIRLDLLSWLLLLIGVTAAGLFGAAWRGVTLLPARGQLLEIPRIGARSSLLFGAAVLIGAGAVILSRTPLSARGIQGNTALWLLPGARPGLVRVGVSSSELRQRSYVLAVSDKSGTRFTSTRIRLEPGQTWTTTIRIPPSDLPVRVLARLFRGTAHSGDNRFATLLVH
jgi:hypothetical protein